MKRFEAYVLGNDTPRTLCEEIDKLNENIEKMKMCENCKRCNKKDFVCENCKRGDLDGELDFWECYK